MLADRFESLIESQILLPLGAVASIVVGAGSIETKEAGETVGAEFALEDFKGESLKFVVRQLIGSTHDTRSLTHNSGLRGVFGASADCAVSCSRGRRCAHGKLCARSDTISASADGQD